MRILNILRKYKEKFNNKNNNPANHLLRIELNSQNLISNIAQFKDKFPNHNLSAVLKGNAYGHGLREIGELLDSNNDISHFIVDNLIEAKLLRGWGIKKEIIILGYVPTALLFELKKLKKIILVINSLEQAEILSKKIDFSLDVLLKIDTGMRRQGMMVDELSPAVCLLKENNNIKIKGMITHLADADNEKSISSLVQLKKWREAMAIYKKVISQDGIFSFSATAGTKYLGESEGNLIRLGIGLYGFNPQIFNKNKDGISALSFSPDFLDLKPVLSWKAKIINIKNLKKGEGIGYGFVFKAKDDIRVAILPCGYFEGVPIRSSNSGFVRFNNNPLRILGKISMNLMAVDISDIENINLEDEVEIFSDDINQANSILNVAKICETIPYEILCKISPSIRRQII